MKDKDPGVSYDAVAAEYVKRICDEPAHKRKPHPGGDDVA